MGEGKPATKPLCSLGSCGQLLCLLWPLVPNFPKQSRLSFTPLPPPLSALQDHGCAHALSWFTLQTPPGPGRCGLPPHCSCGGTGRWVWEPGQGVCAQVLTCPRCFVLL